MGGRFCHHLNFLDAYIYMRIWSERIHCMENGQSVFFLSPHTPYGRVRLARFARVRLLRHALPISLLILRKKNDCFAVYSSVAFHPARNLRQAATKERLTTKKASINGSCSLNFVELSHSFLFCFFFPILS